MNSLDGHALAEEVMELSVDFSRMTEELADILTVKAARWAMYRADPECKSDTAAEKKWSNTPEGIKEMQLKLKMKASEKHQSAIKAMLRVIEIDYRNTPR